MHWWEGWYYGWLGCHTGVLALSFPIRHICCLVNPSQAWDSCLAATASGGWLHFHVQTVSSALTTNCILPASHLSVISACQRVSASLGYIGRLLAAGTCSRWRAESWSQVEYGVELHWTRRTLKILMTGKDLADCHGKITLLEGLARRLCAAKLSSAAWMWVCGHTSHCIAPAVKSACAVAPSLVPLQPDNFVPACAWLNVKG